MQEGKFNHAIHNLLEDNLSEDSDDDIPETKDQQFEFSNSYSIMRLLKMLLFVQIVALMVDHPAAELSIIFRIVMNGLLSYSTTFYSRPFLDLIYVIQYFLQSIVNFARSQDIDTPNSKIEVSTERRSLSSEP